VVLLAAFCVPFFAGFLSAMVFLQGIELYFQRITDKPEMIQAACTW